MGSGASSEKEVSQSNGQDGQVDDVDNYDELYTNQVEVEEKEVELSAFPSLQSSRYWQKKHLVDPELDPETLKWKPTPHNVDLRSVKALQEKEVNTEVEEELLTSSIEALVQKLVENSESESEKVLIFYRWIQHAIDTAIPPSASEQHAAYYLNKIQKQPYMALDLFVKMAEVCEIHCEIIQGYAKGASFAKRLGEQIRLNEPNHHWLAVNMNTYWYLIDLVWCIQQKTDFYFLCEPAVFVYNHFPKESKWQLLYRTLTKSEFTQLAFVHKAFYYHELECLSHPMCVINTSSGEEIIRIGYKEERIWSFRIIAEKNGAIIRNIGGVTIEKCVLVEAYDGVARFNMRFPSVAKYRLDIFCQDPDYTATEPSLVVTYIIQASKSLPNFINFPALDTTIWGATPIPAKLGLIPKSHTRGRIPVEESVQITFSSEKERFLVCHLDSEQDTDFDLEQCVIDSYKSEDKEVSVNVLLPATGFYKLVICLEPEKQGSVPVYVMTYLLECSKPFSQKLVFQNYGDKLGVQSMKKILLEATRTKNLHKLRAAVAVMNANQLHEKVSTEAELAIDMLSKMEQIDEMKQAIEQTDRGTMSEMRNYSKPPKAVHDVLIAALLLLGDSEDSTKLWTDVQSRCGNIGRWSLSRRVRSFNIVYVHHEIAARSQEILERHDINELKSISPGAALFYSWSMNICSEVLNRVESPAKPASVKRQKEIFNMIAKGTWPNIDESGAPVVTV